MSPTTSWDVRGQRGSGLIELMVTLVLLSIVMLAVFNSFFRTSDESRRVNKLVEARQNARLAVQLIERDTRMAGSGWGRSTVYYSSNGTPMSLSGINAGYGGSDAANDSMELVGAWSTNTVLRSSMPNPSAIIKVQTGRGFKDGDLCVITDGGSAHMFQVTEVADPPGDIQHNPASPFNVPGGFSNWPASGYGPGAEVFRISRVVYRVDSLNFGRPCLVRQEFGEPPQVACWDVSHFVVNYRMQDGSWTRSPSSVAFIDRIRPSIVMKIDQSPRPAWTDSSWAEIRPRTF